MVKKEMISSSVEEYGSTENSYYAAILSLLLVVFLLWQIKKQNAGNEIIAGEIIT